jgi:hypothetical protein
LLDELNHLPLTVDIRRPFCTAWRDETHAMCHQLPMHTSSIAIMERGSC